MDWFKKHTDALIVVSAIISCMIWMNGKFNEIEKEIAIMKTVLIVKQVMPNELACRQIKDKNEVKS
jgi:hypothetical protein